MQPVKITDLKIAEDLLRQSIAKNFGDLPVQPHFRPQLNPLLGDAWSDVALELAVALRRPAGEISELLVSGVPAIEAARLWADREFINIRFDDTDQFLFGDEPERSERPSDQVIALVGLRETEHTGPTLVALAMAWVQVAACLDCGYKAEVANWNGKDWTIVSAESWIKESFFDLIRIQQKFTNSKALISGLSLLASLTEGKRTRCWIAGSPLSRVELSVLLRKHGQSKRGLSLCQVGEKLKEVNLDDLKAATERSTPAALALYLAAHAEADLIDLAVPSLAEAANLVWLTCSASKRVASLSDPCGSDCHAAELVISETEHQLLARLRYLPRFYQEAGQFGEVAAFCQILEQSLLGVLKILHRPDLRLSQSLGELSKNQLNFLSGIAQRLSAIVDRSRLFIR